MPALPECFSALSVAVDGVSVALQRWPLLLLVRALQANGGGSVVMFLTTAVLQTLENDGMSGCPKTAVGAMVRLRAEAHRREVEHARWRERAALARELEPPEWRLLGEVRPLDTALVLIELRVLIVSS